MARQIPAAAAGSFAARVAIRWVEVRHGCLSCSLLVPALEVRPPEPRHGFAASGSQLLKGAVGRCLMEILSVGRNELWMLFQAFKLGVER